MIKTSLILFFLKNTVHLHKYLITSLSSHTPIYKIMKIFYLMIMPVIILFANNGITNINQNKIQIQEENQNPTGQNFLNEKQLQGVDFYATGTEPSWSLDMDFEGNFHFKTMSGIDIIFPASKGVKAMDADVIRYRSVNKSAELIVQISHRTCTDNMSDKSYHYSVTVDYKSQDMKNYQTYKGCGNFVYDLRLNDIWAIIQLGDETLKASDFKKGLPTIELNTSKETVIGFDGCNRFRGSFEVADKEIIFSNLAGTRMACQNMQISDRISSALDGKSFHFTLKNGKLILSKNNKTVMVLKHID